jgi:hypothetical protein
MEGLEPPMPVKNQFTKLVLSPLNHIGILFVVPTGVEPVLKFTWYVKPELYQLS